jgi:hypothetical protein
MSTPAPATRLAPLGATRNGPRNRPSAGAAILRQPLRWEDEAGFVGGFEVLPFGFLVFVIGLALLVNAWGVIDAKLVASAAAREATRAFVESPGPTSADALAEARRAATAAVEGHKADPGDWGLRTEGAAQLRRCSLVTFVVTYDVPTFALPWIGGFAGSLITATGRHSEVVDPYRQGLEAPSAAVPNCRG